MTMMEVQVWCKEKSKAYRWKPIGRSFNREQALGQAWLVRQLFKKQGVNVCRVRIRQQKEQKKGVSKHGHSKR
jgi:hypothetical protein